MSNDRASEQEAFANLISNYEECANCGADMLSVIDDKPNYRVLYNCRNCGYEDEGCYSDLYGVMSVPWGFAL